MYFKGDIKKNLKYAKAQLDRLKKINVTSLYIFDKINTYLYFRVDKQLKYALAQPDRLKKTNVTSLDIFDNITTYFISG